VSGIDLRTEWLPLWEPERITQEISQGAIYQHLDEPRQRELSEIADIDCEVRGALDNPKPLDVCRPVLDAVLSAQNYELFQVLGLPRNLAVYEPCVGASDPVIIAAEAFSEGQGRYMTINLNRQLREGLQNKIGHVRMPVEVIEDNALRALELLPPNSFDVACFHHAVNDILQTAVSEPRGMDTTQIDWFPNERQMIEWLAEDAEAGRLEQRGKPELLEIIGSAARLVRPGGYIILDHWNWCSFIGVAWFPWDLFANLIPMTRQWIGESDLPLREVPLDGVDPQWCMVLRADVGNGE
jgi:hypothetical protein